MLDQSPFIRVLHSHYAVYLYAVCYDIFTAILAYNNECTEYKLLLLTLQSYHSHSTYISLQLCVSTLLFLSVVPMSQLVASSCADITGNVFTGVC